MIDFEKREELDIYWFVVSCHLLTYNITELDDFAYDVMLSCLNYNQCVTYHYPDVIKTNYSTTTLDADNVGNILKKDTRLFDEYDITYKCNNDEYKLTLSAHGISIIKLKNGDITNNEKVFQADWSIFSEFINYKKVLKEFEQDNEFSSSEYLKNF